MTSKPGIPLNEPQTEAGRRYLADPFNEGSEYAHNPHEIVLEIEEQARAIEREARGIPLIDVELRAMKALTPIHPTPWVVYEKRGANWIKDADHQWVGFTYSLAVAHLLVQIINESAADIPVEEPDASWTDPGVITPNPDGTVSWRPSPVEEGERSDG